MLKKIVSKRFIITPLWTALVVFMIVSAMIYGDIPQKKLVMALAIILPCVSYTVVRIVFGIIGKEVTIGEISIAAWIVLGVSLFRFIAPNIDYIRLYPDYFVILPMGAFGVGVGVLDAMARLFARDMTDKK